MRYEYVFRLLFKDLDFDLILMLYKIFEQFKILQILILTVSLIPLIDSEINVDKEPIFKIIFNCLYKPFS